MGLYGQEEFGFVPMCKETECSSEVPGEKAHCVSGNQCCVPLSPCGMKFSFSAPLSPQIPVMPFWILGCGAQRRDHRVRG
ncbi:unnamed protein product [Staurois parvus]|uniref:Beta-defensin n=1 Tax=Staurois parvus TaxID=386267 RepID=A0ABN9AUS8_9NEOB|nr:unnamed protein product [Staurois parvus]